MRTRVLAVSAATVITVGMAGTAAIAEVPTNDNIENATVITSLPYAVEQDVTDATKLKTDPPPPCDHGVRSNVWWTITPSSSGWLAADTKGSRIGTVAAVFKGSPGSLTKVACNDDTVRNDHYIEQAKVFWNAKAGTQYYLLIAKDYGRGGDLKLTVDNSPPPFSVDSLTVDPTGTVDHQSGTAVISGTMSCTSGPGEVYLQLRVRQQIGHLYINGSNSKRVDCDGTVAWQAKVASSDGAFSGGQLDVRAEARWEQDNSGRVAVPTTTVRLHG